MTGEQRVTLSAGGTSVEIWCTKLDHQLDKPLIHLPLPRQTDGTTFSKAFDSYIIDIGKVKEIITIQGYLVDDSTSSATQKKAYLITLAGDTRDVTISWGSGSFNQSAEGNIQKVNFTETAGLLTDGTQIGASPTTGNQPEKNFAVQLAIFIGTDKSGGS